MEIATLTQIHQLENEIFDKPREQVEDDVLQSADGPVRLLELFGKKDALIVVNNMGRGCACCTLWAGGFNGVVDELTDRAFSGRWHPFELLDGGADGWSPRFPYG